MALGSVLSFWAVAALLIAVPGPDWAFAISAGLRGQVVPAAAGIVIGYAAMTVVVAGGLGAVIASAPAALTVLTVVGSGYLIWLGVGILRHPGAWSTSGSAGSGTGTVLHGIAVSGLNPKGLLVFVAVLPQFGDPDGAWPLATQLAALGATFAGTCAVVYLCVGSVARRLLNARPTAARIVSGLSGVSMVIVGGVLLIEHVSRG